MSGEFGGQFLRISSPFSKDQIMCRSVILMQLFTQKHFRQKTFLQKLQLLGRIYRSAEFLETFPTIVGN